MVTSGGTNAILTTLSAIVGAVVLLGSAPPIGGWAAVLAILGSLSWVAADGGHAKLGG